MNKDVKKLLAEHRDEILPDHRVKEKVKRDLGISSVREGRLAYAHGGERAFTSGKKAAVAVVAVLLIAALFLGVFLPLWLSGGGAPPTGQTDPNDPVHPGYGVFGTIFGQLLGYITAKGRGKLHGKLVEQLVFIPYLIPSVAFGGIYLSMFSKPQTLFGVTLVPALYGTFALLTLVSVVKHLPFAARAGTSNMLQISGELEEAATIEGAGFFRRFVKIVFPLSKGGFISGFMLIFVSIMKELDLIILIMTPTTSTLPYLAFRYQNGNSAQASDCVAIVMFSIVFLVYAIANLSDKADLAKSMAG